MHRNGLVWVHVEQSGANNVDHLLSASCVNRHLQMPDLDAEITTETVKNKKYNVLKKDQL